MKTVPLATFNSVEPARRLHERLQQAGVPAKIHDESKLERFWFMSEPLAAIHVEVNQPDYLKATLLVEEWHQSEGVMREAVRCPACDSARLEFPQITRKFLMPVATAVLMALRFVPRQFYCLDCHFTWPKDKQIEPARDLLGWPVESKLWHPERTEESTSAH